MNLKKTSPFPYSVTALVFGLLVVQSPAAFGVTVGDVCRIKGQESTTLHGSGLVVGLPGTGDDALPTGQALARMMTRFGTPIQGANGADLKKLKNVAFVHVTATLPPEGMREGGRVNVRVSAIGAKSISGGLLAACALLGPNPRDERVFAEASGQINIEDPANPTVGVVQFGGRMVRDVFKSFHEGGFVSLVIESNHAGFSTAQEIEYAINEDKEFEGQNLAKAVDAKTVIARIPDSYRDAPVLFATALQNIPLDALPVEQRVVIFERSGVISIGSQVQIRPTAIKHQNMTIDIGGREVNQFVPLAPGADTSVESLTALITALNAMQVSASDTIEIIKSLDRQGALYGQLIID